MARAWALLRVLGSWMISLVCELMRASAGQVGYEDCLGRWCGEISLVRHAGERRELRGQAGKQVSYRKTVFRDSFINVTRRGLL